MKSVKVLFAFTMILFMAFPAHSFVEPDGFGGYRWGQKFEEFQSMGPLLVDDEDKRAVAQSRFVQTDQAGQYAC